MAKVYTDGVGVTHLRGKDGDTLCGNTPPSQGVSDGVLTCRLCAQIALAAVELVTKVEKREWRKL